MPSPSERLEILNRLERGELSTEQAAELLSGAQTNAKTAASPMEVLEQLERGEIDPEQAARRLGAAAAAPEAEEDALPRPRRVEVLQPASRKNWWALAIASGSLLALLAGLWMRADLQDGLGLAFFCAWLPLLLGVLLIVLGWFSRQSPWASVRIRSRKAAGRAQGRLNLGLPVPVGLVSQVFKFAGDRVSGVDLGDVESIISALDEARKSGQPIIIQANSDDDNETVDIQIS